MAAPFSLTDLLRDGPISRSATALSGSDSAGASVDASASAAAGRPVPEQLKNVREIPAREARYAPWPEWLHPQVREAFERLGVHEPWLHQVQAADAAHAGENVIVATGTASGKSLAYQLPVLDAVVRDRERVLAEPGRLHTDRSKVLYLSPTKALGADQLSALEAILRAGELSDVKVASYDGDTDPSARRWVRDHADVILCNPDMLHVGVLPNHRWWGAFLANLRYVVVDEAHSYRGVFGAHVAVVLRRLRRLCRLYGGDPVFIGASATVAEPAVSFGRLIGSEVTAVTDDASPHGKTTVAFWEPGLTETTGENGAPTRRTSIAESAILLADLVLARVRTIAFIKSRRGAEAISANAKRHLDGVDAALAHRVAAYRSGYLPEERRELESQLRSGTILGVASTPALELGIDISGLDAVIVAGWPGTRASLFQQIGRAGRSGQEALAAFVAGDDTLDTYLVNHPEAIFDVSVEASVFDPENPYVLRAHLCAAAAELPITPEDFAAFGATTPALLEELVERGVLRRRAAGWFWTHRESPAAMVNLRDSGGGPLTIIDSATGEVVGNIGAGIAQQQAHAGAVYTHQGRTYVVDELREDDGAVMVSRAWPDYYTTARSVTEIEVISTDAQRQWGEVTLNFGAVKVTDHVVSFQKKSVLSNEVLGEEPLDLAPKELFTKAFWVTLEPEFLRSNGVEPGVWPGALHAAEHAAIGMLPLVASSDRWDVGGVSTALHQDTGLPTIFVYDGHPGGAGFSERGYHAAEQWLMATKEAILSCECEAGCPSCVQSPKCGNRNNPLDKYAAAELLGLILRRAPFVR